MIELILLKFNAEFVYIFNLFIRVIMKIFEIKIQINLSWLKFGRNNYFFMMD